MPALRLSAPSLACAAFVSVLVLLACQTSSPACPVIQPRPLRILYAESDLIVVARLGDTVKAESNDENTLLKTRLLVSETLKGESDEKGVFVFHWVWNGGGQIGNIKPGEKLLLFLNRRDQSDGYQLIYPEYALKRLTDAELKVYRQRIVEMSVIMRQNPPDTGDLVEWLVRCAEDPATRWEGAYELANMVQYAEDEKAGAAAASVEKAGDAETASPATSSATQENATATTTVAADASSSSATPAENASEQSVSTDTVTVTDNDVEIKELPLFGFRWNVISNARLTVEQKNRLLDTLYNSQSFGFGEAILLDWMKDWNDARLVPFLVSQLERVKDKPDYYAEQMISLLAAKLDDKELVELAEDYGQKARYTDEAEETETASEENAEASDSSVEDDAGSEDQSAEATDNAAANEQSEQATDNAAATQNAEAVADDDEDKNDKRTSAQKRSARLQSFLAAVELKMMQQMARKW